MTFADEGRSRPVEFRLRRGDGGPSSMRARSRRSRAGSSRDGSGVGEGVAVGSTVGVAAGERQGQRQAGHQEQHQGQRDREVEADGREYYLRCKPDGTIIQKLARVPAVIEVPLP